MFFIEVAQISKLNITVFSYFVVEMVSVLKYLTPADPITMNLILLCISLLIILVHIENWQKHLIICHDYELGPFFFKCMLIP